MNGNLTLVDSSAWIEYFRSSGDPKIADAVDVCIVASSAVLCEMVLLELKRGGNEKQVKMVNGLQKSLNCYRIDSETWDIAYNIASQLRKKGIPVPNTDILIFACARRYRLSILHHDRHFDVLAGISFSG